MNLIAKVALSALLTVPTFVYASDSESASAVRDYPEVRLEEGLNAAHRLRLEAMSAIFREFERVGIDTSGRVIVLYLHDNRFILEAKPVERSVKDGFIRATYDPVSGKVADVYSDG